MIGIIMAGSKMDASGVCSTYFGHKTVHISHQIRVSFRNQGTILDRSSHGKGNVPVLFGANVDVDQSILV